MVVSPWNSIRKSVFHFWHEFRDWIKDGPIKQDPSGQYPHWPQSRKIELEGITERTWGESVLNKPTKHRVALLPESVKTEFLRQFWSILRQSKSNQIPNLGRLSCRDWNSQDWREEDGTAAKLESYRNLNETTTFWIAFQKVFAPFTPTILEQQFLE